MRAVRGTFKGTANDMYLCVGFVPDWVSLWNMEATAPVNIVWDSSMQRSSTMAEGFIHTWHGTFGSSDAEELAAGAGISTYYGGVMLNSTTAGTVTFGEGVFLKFDNRDYRYLSSDSPWGTGDAASETIDTWTFASGYTGSFNGTGVSKTYTGEGSIIQIDGRRYAIGAISSNGELSGEVTISNTGIASGKIEFISQMYSMTPIISGELTRDGFMISNTDLNANGEMCSFEAGKY